MNHFLIRLWCATKSGLYLEAVVGPTWSSKALPKAKLPPKGHSHCLVACWQSNSLELSESQWNHYIQEVCSANRWDAPKTATPASGIGQPKGPNSSPQQCLTTCLTCFKSWTNWGTKFCLIHHIQLISCQPTTTTFCRENASTTSKEAENAFQKFLKFWSTYFYATGINQLISYWQRYVGCNGSYFD